MFAIRCELEERETFVISVLFFGSIIILAFILRIFELPYEQNDKINSNNLSDYGSSIWLTTITITTVGYGDIYPQTVGGYFAACTIALWGAFVVSLLIMVV
jgi:voltage-gated potassium channel Kch